MSVDKELGQLEAEVRELEAAIEAQVSAARRTPRAPIFAAVTLALIAGSFFSVNYFWFRSAWSTEKLGRSLERELAEVSPTALRELQRLGQDLLPVYASELEGQLQLAWPRIADRLNSELDELGSHVLTHVHQRLHESEGRILEASERIIFESYPQLRDPARREELHERLHAACEKTLLKSLQDFDSLFSQDLQRVEEVLLRFDLTDTSETTVDLQKKFLRLWLRLLDQEIMEI